MSNQPWIQTYTNGAVDLLDPRPEQIKLMDIAHALSRICRYTGHLAEHYSVAQHSVEVSLLVPDRYARVALLHDAAEAYVGDVSQPLKRAMRQFICADRSVYDAIEDRVQAVIYEAFGISTALVAEASADVKRADLVMLSTEKYALLGPSPRPWGLKYEPRGGTLVPMRAEFAREMFLDRWRNTLISGS